MSELGKQSNVKKVRHSLSALSEGVFTFYERAMSRIEEQWEQDRSLARRALSYIFCARRPLVMEELLHVWLAMPSLACGLGRLPAAGTKVVPWF
jgi:hypothetical protein